MRSTALAKKLAIAKRRRLRIRKRVRGSAERPRLAFHKSLRHLCAQAIDDDSGRTLAHVTTCAAAARAEGKRSHRSVASAKALGEAMAAALSEHGISTVVFDRGGHLFHGVTKAFADAVREKGIRI